MVLMVSAWMELFQLAPDFRNQISFLKSNKSGVEMHCECDFTPFGIQPLTMSQPCIRNSAYYSFSGLFLVFERHMWPFCVRRRGYCCIRAL